MLYGIWKCVMLVWLDMRKYEFSGGPIDIYGYRESSRIY